MIKKKILAVDDNTTNLHILPQLLKEYDVIIAANGFDALDIVNKEAIDLILLDIMMPDIDGYDVCQVLKSREAHKNIPIIFLTAQTDNSAAEKAYDVGAIDLIRRPLNPKELLAKVRIQFQLQDLIQDLETSQEKLEQLVAKDPLTHLYNKKYFIESAEHIFQLAKREQSELSLVMLEVDNIKQSNDMIMTLAAQLQKTLRKSDVLCRFSSKKFLILLPGTDIKGAKVLIERITKNTEQISITPDNKESPTSLTNTKLAISIGSAQLNHKTDTILDTLLNKTEQALQQTKK